MTANPADEPRVDDDPKDTFALPATLPESHVEKLAEANGRNARFWGDHFAEIEAANRAALGAHHKPGHTVAELITALVQELAEAREFGNDAMTRSSEQAQELGKWVEGYGKLSADNKRLTRELGEAQALADIRLRGLQDALAVNTDFQKVGRKRLGLPWHCPSDLDAALEALQVQLASRPAIPADAEDQIERVLHEHDGTGLRLSTKLTGLMRSWSAPVSGSDTTAAAALDSVKLADLEPWDDSDDEGICYCDAHGTPPVRHLKGMGPRAHHVSYGVDTTEESTPLCGSHDIYALSRRCDRPLGHDGLCSKGVGGAPWRRRDDVDSDTWEVPYGQ